MSQQLKELRAGLIEDIEALKLQELRLQAQRLKCETAVVEIDVMMRHPTGVGGLVAEEGPGPEEEVQLTVVAMIRAILPQLKGKTFWYSDIKELCLKSYPDEAGKIRKGIHPACYQLKQKHEIIAVSGGFKLPQDCK